MKLAHGVLLMLAVGQITVTLLKPDGTQLDVTERTELSSLGGITEALEGDELLELVHSDFDLEMQDPDGTLAAMFRDSSSSEVWEVLVERYTGRRRGKWDRIFAGILDVPATVEIDRKERRVAVQAFSYSKLLERVDVEAQRRFTAAFPDRLDGQEATVSAGSSFVTLSPGFSAKLLKTGDRIVIDDGTNREERVVSVQHLNNIFVTIENFDNAFTNANIEILTPWPWHMTIQESAEALLSSFGIFVQVDVDNVTSRAPFLSGFDSDGVNTTGVIQSLVPQPGTDPLNTLVGLWAGGGRWHASSPSSGMVLSAVTTQEGDWTPYLASRPAVVETVPPNVQNATGKDTQLNINPVPDDQLDWVAAYDHEGGFTYTLRQRHAPVSDDPQIRLFRDGALLVGVTEQIGGAADKYHTAFLDWFERSAHGFTDDIAVVSTQAHNGVRRLDVVNLGTSTAFNIVTGNGGGGGGVRTLGDRGQVAVQQAATDDLNQPNIPATIGFWKPAADGTYLTLDRTLTDQPVMQMWTMRSFGDFVACLYLSDSPTPPSSLGFQKRQTRCRVWRWDTLEQVADFQVQPFAHPEMYMTRVTLQGVQSLVVAVKLFMHSLSTDWVGTVPYINFDDIGGGAALRDIALLTLSFLHVDQHKVASIRGRASTAGNQIELAEAEVVEWIERPLTDGYVASIEVEGKDSAGQDFTVVIGDEHESSARASIDSSLIRDTGLAESVGEGYHSLLAGRRAQHDVTVRIGQQAWRANDVARFLGCLYRVVEVETDLEQGTQALKLVQILTEADAEIPA